MTRKVLIGTPAHDGRLDVWYCNSLVNTIRLSAVHKVRIDPIYVSYDSLVQRARNDLVRMALEEDYDDLIFIDSDEEWDPEWIFTLLNHPVDVVGATVVKKQDNPILFNVKALPEGLEIKNGLIEVVCVGTGFLRISRKALQAVWDVSEEYKNEGRTCRMVFDVRVENGELVSEDNIFCNKWRSTGGKVFIDPSMTCNHIGVKKFSGNFMHFYDWLKSQNKQAA
jgi:glycosyltransferase involved in cell wall biosynthesis